jgi:hypothetical protein
LSSDTKTLNVISVDASPAARVYEGHFVLPLTYDTNIINDLTGREKEGKTFDEFVFTDQSNTKYRAKRLFLTGHSMDNHFTYEKDGAFATGSHIFSFKCSDFSQD